MGEAGTSDRAAESSTAGGWYIEAGVDVVCNGVAGGNLALVELGGCVRAWCACYVKFNQVNRRRIGIVPVHVMVQIVKWINHFSLQGGTEFMDLVCTRQEKVRI